MTHISKSCCALLLAAAMLSGCATEVAVAPKSPANTSSSPATSSSPVNTSSSPATSSSPSLTVLSSPPPALASSSPSLTVSPALSPSTSLSSSPSPALAHAALGYKVDPASLALEVTLDGSSVSAASPMPSRAVAGLTKEKDATSWEYPSEQVSVQVMSVQDYVSVAITSTSAQDATFAWPQVAADEYYLPLGEGKRVPADSAAWQEYLGGKELLALEQLSMPFWASSVGDYAAVYIMENPHRSQLNFAKSGKLAFNVSYTYPQISTERTKRFRIYLTENNPTAVAKVYRRYLVEQDSLVTLTQKAKAVPDISKLYGAPFIYLWGNFVVSPSDIQWGAFRQSVDSPVMSHLLTFAATQENGAEFKKALNDIKGQASVWSYQQNLICNYISSVLAEDSFWDSGVLASRTPAMSRLLTKGEGNLTSSERLQLNKCALAANMPGVFNEPDTWMNADTVNLFRDMRQSGIDNAWIGLHGWEQAYAKPELVKAARDEGYLIASYDSYHSIHEPGKEQWETARFDDTTLYERATVTDQAGNKLGGFQGVGRKLNPVLAMPSVQSRMRTIVEDNKLAFNSWFVDCDATGEIYDDYTPSHVTTQEADLAARLQRMAYIRDSYRMVVGSEGGNDFAASTIAFAHGIELKSFSWMDADMKTNKNSEYYMGKYYNPTGGVAEHFAKRVPLKEQYYTIFVDPRYDLPLFRLVYNDAVISGYHWEWGTFKIKNATQTRMLREVLYNVPPMYHLDADQWGEYKADIIRHTSVWSRFSRRATMQEMTSFSRLSSDGLVQLTQYGADISVVANFGTAPYRYQQQEVPAMSALIYMDGKATVYTPTVAEGHR